jgi:hypothetical protein
MLGAGNLQGCLYTSDTGPVERLYGTSIIEALPEEVARQMRDAFSI